MYKKVETHDDDSTSTRRSVDALSSEVELVEPNYCLGSLEKPDDEFNSVISHIHDEDPLTHQENAASLAVNIFRLESLALPSCYLMVGMVQGMIYPFLNVYPLDLGATEAQQSTIMSLKGLPSCFKIFFGLISDTLPIFGYRRKPYMLIGWAVASLSIATLLTVSDVSLERIPINNTTSADSFSSGHSQDPESFEGTIVVNLPQSAPSIPLLSTCIFVWAVGVWLADVIGDSLVAERAKFENPEDRGNLQIICYVMRGIGLAVMSPVSLLLYKLDRGPLIILASSASLPMAMVPLIFLLNEKKFDCRLLNAGEYFSGLWDTCCMRAVWQPVGFCFLYIVLFVSNAAWKEFLKTVLGFTPEQINALLIIAGVMAFAGVVLYKFVLIKWSWRSVFVTGILLNSVFSILQLCLIQGYTFGVSPFLFSMGDEGAVDFILGTQYIPTVVILVTLVPDGIEGASYALFTTTWNVGGVLSDAISTNLLRVWDVSKATMENGDLSGIFKLSMLTTALQTLPILFVGMVPHGVEELNQLRCSQGSSVNRSRVGGTMFLSTVMLALLYAVFVGIMNIFRPGWMGES